MADAEPTEERSRDLRSELSIKRLQVASKRLLTAEEYRWLISPIVAFLITRGLLLVGAYIGRVAFIEVADSLPWQAHPENVFLDIWDRWDSVFYRSIVTEGYVFGPDNPGNVAFFPLQRPPVSEPGTQPLARNPEFPCPAGQIHRPALEFNVPGRVAGWVLGRVPGRVPGVPGFVPGRLPGRLPGRGYVR